MCHDSINSPCGEGESNFFRDVLDASPMPTIILERCSDALRPIYVNRSFERQTGYTLAAVLDQDWRILCGFDDDCAPRPDLASGTVEETRIPFRGSRLDGTPFWSELTLSPLRRDGSGLRYVGVLRDVTAERAERVRLARFALHDDLTGLPNRRALDHQLALAIERARAEQRVFPLLLLDLDRFKNVNDAFGHEAGDELLRIVGTRLRHELRAGDTVARIGGDEFVLVLESVREPVQLADIRDRLCIRVAAPVLTDGATINVGCSVGASWYPLHGEDARSLLRHADKCMYEEKRRNHLQEDGLFAVTTQNAFAMRHSIR